MRAEPGTVLHFSEDPHLGRFVPHVARTATERAALVWAVDAASSPSYWFPRQCPRALAWVRPGTTEADRRAVLGPEAERVHVVEYGWLTRIQTTRLYAYRFDAADFRPYGEPEPHAHVADHPVTPLGPPRPVGDLLALHEEAGIELRLVHDLRPWWRAVTRSTVGHSGIRLAGARSPAGR
ncbi:hypothetical protein SAMN04488543_2674 [Friedmanniella luteola]|uniref:Uncharacterized protein n=1 Tax=Friedmanniella luteola TaxID=546871 RepID=A0A1H1W8M1_9ACTN|nr:DUF6886 family protein [Friedmanniella luteola]SDS93444.1 hypothetical protein SAMN04488543_2674 [Friedmanniella luteola]